METMSVNDLPLKCDYCSNFHICRITIHNKYWYLCYNCLVKNKERFLVTKKQIEELKEHNENGVYV